MVAVPAVPPDDATETDFELTGVEPVEYVKVARLYAVPPMVEMFCAVAVELSQAWMVKVFPLQTVVPMFTESDDM